MAWTQQTTNAAASHTLTLAVTAGDLIFVGLGWGSGTLSDLTSITDDASNSYTLFTGAADAGNSQSSRGGWAIAGTTATITITGNGISGFGFKFANAVSYRESGTISFIGQNQAFNSFSTSTDAINSGNITPSAVDDLIICFVQNTGFGPLTLDPGTGYTLSVADAANPSRVCLTEYKIATSTSAQAATATQSNASSVALFVTVFHATGGASPTTTIVTGSATAAVGIAETYTYTLDADPGASTVNVTPTHAVAGSWSASPLALTTSNWNTGLSSNHTASAAGSGNVSSTNDGGLTNDTLAVTVYSVSRPSAVTAGSWTDEAGGSLVVTDINDASDSTGAKDPAGASYPVLAFTMDTPMAASVAQTCYFRGRDITAGKQARQVLFATDGTTVVATGAWHTMTGSLATYSDVLTPTATAYKGEIQTQEYIPIFGVIWPSNPDTNSDVRLNWTGAASVSRTAQTIIWKSNYEQQDGYYAVWWRLPDAAPTFVASEWHFGTHPWPGSTSVNSAGQATGGTGGTGTVHQFEIATIGSTVDYITSPSAANGGPFTVTKGVWQTEAATVEVISGTTLRHTYWPDISNPTSYIQQDRVLADLDTPTAERVVFGGSPWTADNPTSGKNAESASGTFRYWKMFSAALSITDIATEAASESDSAVTTAGIASEFYSNINPTPTDVTDKSGNGNDPAWANSNRPTLYTG